MKRLLLGVLLTGWVIPAFADNFCYHLYDLNNGKLIHSYAEPPHELKLPQTERYVTEEGVPTHLVITVDNGDCGFENDEYNMVIKTPPAS